MKNGKTAGENESKEKIIIPRIGNQENKLEKNESKADNLKLIANTQNRGNCGTKLSRDLVNNNHMTEKDLSDDEVSPGFETVSSIDYNVDSDEMGLNAPADEDDINVVIQIENELAFQNERSRRACYWKGRKKTPVRFRSRTEVSSSDYTNTRDDGFKKSREQKYWQSKNEERRYKSDRRDKKSTERDFSRRSSSRDLDWSRSNNYTRHRSKKTSDNGSRSRHSTSSEKNYRSRASRSMERNIRVIRHKDRKTDARHSGSFEKNTIKSNIKRNSARKRRSSLSKSPSSIWKRLDKRITPERVNSPSLRNFSRKKERTPFLVELERKLKEAGQLKNEPINASLDKMEVSVNYNNPQPVPAFPTGVNQNTRPSNMPMFVAPTPNNPGVCFPFQYTPFPTLSVDNLPLVPGPLGLPVHITATGEQIPHDLDGRCIPVGPNGYYLPLDPTGRLFPHIVSPTNQAVPIHMTEDGVLRLPNSEPVPYGPSHQLPVNIDGRVILIGPDSKPLYPCLNLPRHPPLHILNMTNSLGTENTGLQGIIQTGTSSTGNKEITGTESQQKWDINGNNFEPPGTSSTLQDVIRNPPQETNDSLKKKKKKARERCSDVLKSIEIRGTSDVNLSKGGIKRSTPMKFLRKKASEDDTCSSGADMVLESGDSDSSSGLKSRSKTKKGSVEEITLSSDEDRGKVCDKESSKTTNTKKETKDLIVKKVKHAIKSLCQKNYKPPVFGRFFISNLEYPIAENSPNESPLLRNRLILPFLTPNAESPREKDEISEKTALAFKFLPPKKTEKGEKCSNVERTETQKENLNAEKIPVFTFDFAMQCDFTSVTIKNLTSKVAELEMEVVRLRNINANLLDGYRNVQAMNQEKGDELKKALLEIRERNKEIQSLKNYA